MLNTEEKVMLGYNELLVEKCSYEKCMEVNKYNEKVYSAPIEINCFKSFNLSNNRSFDEQSLSIVKTIFISNDFEPNSFDKIDGQEIKSIKPVKGLKVKIIGWEIVT